MNASNIPLDKQARRSGESLLKQIKGFHSIACDRPDVRLLEAGRGNGPLSALYERTDPEDTFWAIGLLDEEDTDGS
ncbi:MAG TPA: hypothetical protein VMZ31_10825 [Phycisphaerae bacterium]|nr:hypothetical protein [Phycisphaerae bacterium]